MKRPVETPDERGRRVARFSARVSSQLFADLEASDLLPDDRSEPDRARARREWECFALYACVRGLVAAGGFNRETATAIESMHEQAMSEWDAAPPAGETSEERRRLLSERYEEYGTIGGEGGAAGAATLGVRLGEAAARHMVTDGGAKPELVSWLGGMHEAIAEGVVEALSRPE